MELIHATCIVLNGKGVLLRGKSGSGKSDLALRLIRQGAQLIADDLVELHMSGIGMRAKLPSWSEPYRGVLEVRGVGLVRVPHEIETAVDIVVDLDETVERLPARSEIDVFGTALPWIAVSAFEASATDKIWAAVTCDAVDG